MQTVVVLVFVIYMICDFLLFPEALGDPVHIEQVSGHSFPELFANGGIGGMCLISLILASLFFVAWRAPYLVKEIGIIGMVTGFLLSMYSLWMMCETIQYFGDASPSVVCGGIKSVLIPVIYGAGVYVVSLIIRIVQKIQKR